ncbi:hypothetical protein [Rhodopirellula europaea]|uniref:hypothetical protein n=1 Tax=Rhodopirellula europaea TaxID=1263866 RepID=UPI003D2D20B9|tara:strand:+ start:14659 stop:14925 length:267 start_codon:yes stop_codon:yes gene_type:complete
MLNPSPEEIAAACAEIQSTWTASERINRRRSRPKLPVETDAAEVRRCARIALEAKLAKQRPTDPVPPPSVVVVTNDADAWQLEPIQWG